MTYREYAEKYYPREVGGQYDGGVKGCPCDLIPGAKDLCSCHGSFLPDNYLCAKCWDQTMPGTEEVEADQPKQSMDKETFWQYFEPVCQCKVPDIVKHINYCHHPDSLGPNMECNKHDCPFVKTIYPEPVNQNVDIHKIIDDAMTKKDRSVLICISESGTTVSVTPLDDKKPRWIRKGIDSFCPECNSRSKFESPYCPVCGEKLALPENFWQVPQEG